jgi:hypothetical protein
MQRVQCHEQVFGPMPGAICTPFDQENGLMPQWQPFISHMSGMIGKAKTA